MSTLAEIEQAAKTLPPHEQRKLVESLNATLLNGEPTPAETRPAQSDPTPLDRWFAEIHEAMRHLPSSPTPRDVLEEGRNRLERF
jgi:hypothetical protein